MFEVSGDNASVGYVAGAQITANDRFVMGFSYRSEIKHDLEGSLDFQNVPALLAADPRFQDGAGGARLVTPSVTTFSMSYDVTDRLSLLADYQRTGWASLQDVTIKRASGTVVGTEDFSWKDTDFFSVGVERSIHRARRRGRGRVAD